MAQRFGNPLLIEAVQVGDRGRARAVVVGQVQFGDVNQQRVTIVSPGPATVLSLDPAHTVRDKGTVFAIQASHVGSVDSVESDQRLQPEPTSCQVEPANEFGIQISLAVIVASLQRQQQFEPASAFHQPERHRCKRGHRLTGFCIKRLRPPFQPQVDIGCRVHTPASPRADPGDGRDSMIST